MSLTLTPGIHENIPAERYHADRLCAAPTLSSSIAGVLLNATPRHAWTICRRLNPAFEADDDNKAMDVGSVAHEIILGKGGGFEVLDFPNWATKAAKEARAEVVAAGKTSILSKDFARAQAIAKAAMGAIGETPHCGDFYDPGHASEVVLLWQDAGGPMCRAMLDRLTAGGVVYDIKTTARGLGTRTIQTKIADGLDLQAAFYLRGLAALRPELAGRFRWRWIFVEQDEPNEARVIEADAVTLAMGDRKAALAIEIWRECMASGTWPGYRREIERVEYPAWAEAAWMAREIADDRFKSASVTGRIPTEEPGPDHLIFGERKLELEAGR